eukprot:Pompholyxophrys_punicea_v1_NODE_357_length_2166_cov_19.413548.p1 type:complete len:142 gc:universal NODE_357_length_2166_cov_19.413548:890-465(-)
MRRPKENSNIFSSIFSRQAPLAVRVHAVYAVKMLGMTQSNVAYIFGKSEGTISNWCNKFQETGSIERVRVNDTARYKKLKAHHRNWIVDHVEKDPSVIVKKSLGRAFSEFCQKMATLQKSLKRGFYKSAKQILLGLRMRLI